MKCPGRGKWRLRTLIPTIWEATVAIFTLFMAGLLRKTAQYRLFCSLLRSYPDISSWLDERRAIAERLGYDTLFVVATIVLLGSIIRLIDLPQHHHDRP